MQRDGSEFGGAGTEDYAVVPDARSPTSQPHASKPKRRSFFSLLLVVAGLLLVYTVLGLLVPGFPFVAVAPEADNSLKTIATLVAAGIAILAWIRFVETRQSDSLFQSAAFTVLFASNVIALVLSLGGRELGFEHSDPGQAPLYLWTAQHLLAAPLLLTAALGALGALGAHGWTSRRRRILPILTVLGPAALLLTMAVAILAARDTLPTLIPLSTLVVATQPLARVSADLLSPPMLISQLTIAAFYLAAGLGYGLAHQRSQPERPYFAYMSIGLIVAAFGQVHFAVMPGAFAGLVTSGDPLRISFYAIVGFGLAAATRHDLRELRRANLKLHRMRAADNKRIALEERARLARDVHDGLVQSLWLARLTHGQLAKIIDQADLPPQAHQATQRIDSILGDALAEARQAVLTLQPDEDISFGSLLRRFVEDHADRFGLEVECLIEGAPVALPGHTQAEALRICREAINNVLKHANATLLRVHLECNGDLARLTISDNGGGFESDKPQRRGFGLRGMHERAAGIGGRLHVVSEPVSGTRVTLELLAKPLGRPQQ